MLYSSETIAAISTAMNNSGIGIIRVSGDDAFDIVDKIFVPSKGNKKISDYKSHTIHYGNIVNNGKVIDEVLVMVMKAPATYTREDVVEINCHGGNIVMQKILETVLENGARCAEPGEFTKRAFLNGRIDLSQAEAVIDLINAKNNMAADISLGQLKGNMSGKIKSIRKKIIYHIAYIESALDDPEHYDMQNYGEELRVVIEELIQELNEVIDTADNGRIMTEGIKTVIIGKPNVGKSSLMNTLLGEERAIVTDIEGTTRDSLEESVRLNDINLNIIDTAGIRDTEDVVEKIGVDRAKKHADEADLIIFIIDSSRKIDEEDINIFNFIKDKKALIILNKIDLECVTDESDIRKHMDEDSMKEIIKISAKNNEGILDLTDAVKKMFFDGDISYNDQIFITNERHKQAVINSKNSLKCVLESIDNCMPEDFFTIDMMNAYEYLGEILGEQLGEDLVNEIFSKFCMGK